MINLLLAFLTLKDHQTNINNTGLESLFTYVSEVVPIFFPIMLFSLFVVILLATFFSSKRLTGRQDFPASFAVAGFVTTIVAIFLSLTEGILNLTTLIITIAIAIVGIIWLFISRD